MLEKQTVTFPMRAGLDQGTDADADPQGLLLLDNAVYDKEGAARPRGAFRWEVTMPTGTPRGLVSGRALALFYEDSTGKGKLAPYTPGTGVVTHTQSVAQTATEPFISFFNSRSVQFVEAASIVLADGLRYWAVVSLEWNNKTSASRDGWLRLFDHQGALLYETALTGASGGAGDFKAVRVVATGTGFATALLSDAGSSVGGIKVQHWTVNLASQDFTLDNTNTISTVEWNLGIDLVYRSGFTYVSYGNDAQTTVSVRRIDTSSFVSLTYTSSATTIYAAATAIAFTSTGYLILGYYNGTGVMKLVSINSTSMTDISTIDGTTFTAPSSITMAAVGSTFQVYGGGFTTLVSSLYQATCSVTGSTLAITSSGTSTGMYLLSKPLEDGSVAVGRALASVDGIWGGFLWHPDGYVYSQVGHSVILPDDITNLAAAVNMLSDVAFISFPSVLEVFGEGDAKNLRYTGVIEAVNTRPENVANTTINGITYLASGVLAAWDGHQIVPGAAIGPFLLNSLTASAGAGLTAGVYNYSLVTQLTTTDGQVILSRPSEPYAVTVSGGNLRVDVSLQNYNPALYFSRMAPEGRIEVRVYRTTSNDSTMHLLRVLRSDLSATITFTDSVADTTLEAGELLYTDGGELASDMPPPFRHIWSHRNRVMGINAEKPTQIWFTKEAATPVVPQWNAELIKNVENSGGELIAGASLGDKCVLFQRNQILIFSGEGPDALGNNDSFSTPEIIALGIGAMDGFSVVQVPGGIIFRSDEGFYALSQDGSVNFVGKAVLDVERAMGPTKAAAYFPSLHQAWWSGVDSDKILVYDTRFNRWSTLTGPWTGATGFVEYDGSVYVVDDAAAPKLYRYDLDEAGDKIGEGTYQSFAITASLPWFRPGGQGGHFRVWRVIVTLGRDTIPDVAPEMSAQTFTSQPWRNASKAPDTADADYALTIPDNALGLVDLRIRPVVQRAAAFRCKVVIGTVASGVVEPEALPRILSVKYVFGTHGEEAKTPATTVAS